MTPKDEEFTNGFNFHNRQPNRQADWQPLRTHTHRGTALEADAGDTGLGPSKEDIPTVTSELPPAKDSIARHGVVAYMAAVAPAEYNQLNHVDEGRWDDPHR